MFLSLSVMSDDAICYQISRSYLKICFCFSFSLKLNNILIFFLFIRRKWRRGRGRGGARRPWDDGGGFRNYRSQ